jgi:integrase
VSRRDYQTTRSGRFYRQVTNPVTRRRQRVSAATLAELERRCQEIARIKFDLEFGADPVAAIRKLGPSMSGRGLTVDELWKRYSAAVPSKSAKKYHSAWRNWIAPHLGKASPWELSEARMRVWQATLQREGKASNSISFAFSTLKLVWRLALSAGDVDRYPWDPWRPASPKRRHEPRYVARLDDLADLLMAATAYDRALWDRGRYSHRFYAIGVMALTGLRHAEAAGLAWDCVEIDTVPPRLHIWFQAPEGWGVKSADRPWRTADRPRDPPKAGTKTIQLQETAAQLLRAQRAQLERCGVYRPDGPVFPDDAGNWRRSGKVMTVDTFRRIVGAAGLQGVERWNLHSLRHSHSSLEVIFSGGDLRAASERTRHADLRVLQGYVHSGHKHDASFIPALTQPGLGLTLDTTGVPLELDAPRGLPALGSPSDLVTSIERSASSAREAGQRPTIAGRSLEDHARAWLDAGKPARLPLDVREGFRRAYLRAYQRERRAGASAELCSAAGKRARRASQGAWAQTVARLERAPN